MVTRELPDCVTTQIKSAYHGEVCVAGKVLRDRNCVCHVENNVPPSARHKDGLPGALAVPEIRGSL